MISSDLIILQDKLVQIWSKLLAIDAVGIEDNFFALGGHSLLAIDLLNEVEGYFNIRLNMKDIVEHPTISALAIVISKEASRSKKIAPVYKDADKNIFELSVNQKQVWNLCALYPKSLTHNISTAIKIKKPLNINTINKVINIILERHDCLRTKFLTIDKIPYQKVLPHAPVKLDFIDVAADSLQSILEAEMKYNYDLTQDELLRVKFFRINEFEYVFFFMVHHIVWDGISNTLFFHEFLSLYEIIENDLPLSEIKEKVSYKDHVIREMNYLHSAEFIEEKLSWSQYLKGDLPVLNLGVDYERPSVINNLSDTVVFDIELELLNKLEKFVQSKHISLYNLFFACYNFLLYSKTNDEEFIVGTPVHGRNHRDLRKVLGYFINSLPIRTKLDPKKSFRENIGLVINSLSHAFYNQNVPLETILKNSSFVTHPGRNPLFQTLFVYLDVTKELDLFESNKLELIKANRNSVHTEIDFYMYKSRYKVECVVEFRKELFKPETIVSLGKELISILETVLRDENELLEGLIINPTPIEDQYGLLDAKAYDDLSDEETLLDHFYKSLALDPEKVAIRGQNFSTTYKELNEKSNKVCAFIKSQSIGRGDFVGVCLKRDEYLVITLLGILKAQAAYVPLDPSFPIERLKYMAEKVDAKLVITIEENRIGHNLASNTQTIEQILKSDFSSDLIPEEVVGSDSCYVLFTSGSTGRPKGVEVTHKNVLNFLLSMTSSPGLSKNDNLLAVTTISFDISVLEIFLPLINGGALYLANHEEVVCGDALRAIIQKQNITIMQATPVTWRIILSKEEFIKKDLKILCGGEALQRDLAMKLLSAFGEVWNMYGPTETTVWSLIKKISPQDKKILIGSPINNTSVYILDEFNKIQKMGLPGKLFIGGYGVTKGYIKDLKQTSEKFIKNPFRENDFLYDTGDMARHSSNGELECLGRADDQVKLRGFRIELGEIEDTILSHPSIAQCCVNVVRDELVGYVTLKDKNNYFSDTLIEELKTNAKLKIPQYMIPAKIWILESFPKTLNGKIDRKMLSSEFALNSNNRQVKLSLRPSNNFYNIQHVVEDIWKGVLEVDHVTMDDNFFDLGGHSLMAVEMFGRINEIFNLNLSLSEIFENNSINLISSLVEKTMIDNKKELQSLKTIVQIKSNKEDENPIFCFHGIGGNVLNYYRLSEFVGPRAFYGVQALGINGEDAMLRTIPEMASYYVEEMKKVQPKGPYLLAGGSMGGLIALEVAHQLKQAGDAVSNVIMFDTIGPDLDLKTFGKDNLNLYVRASQSMSRKYDNALTYLKSNYYKFKQVPLPHSIRYKVMENRNFSALLEYIPDVYEGNITLIRAPKSDRGHYADPYLGWRRLIKGEIETIEINGEHHKFLESPEFSSTFKKIVNKF